MMNKITLFLLLFTTWFLAIFFSGNLSIIFTIIGFFISIIIMIFVFRLSIINNTTEYLFLQLKFYSYIFEKINNNFIKLFFICIAFWNPKIEFTSILDYVFLNKDSDAQATFISNLLTLLPGTSGILMKKRYLIVHSLDKDYFSLNEMFNLTQDIEKIKDDSLI